MATFEYDPLLTSMPCLTIGLVRGEKVFAIASDFAIMLRDRPRDRFEAIKLLWTV
jgi:hypothetical protein